MWPTLAYVVVVVETDEGADFSNTHSRRNGHSAVHHP